MWVSPFRNLRIKAYLQLPAAYRSLSRLSSAPSAKAFALRPYSLDRFYGFPFRYSSRKSNPLILHLPTKKFSVFEIAVSNYIYFLSFAVTIQFSRCKLGANLRRKFANISQVKCWANSCLEPPFIDGLYFAFASYKPLHPAASGRSSCFHKKWWAQVDSNHRPRAYQARALTT